MRKLLYSFCSLFLFLSTSAQQTEFSVGANTGFLSFRGRSAVSSSFIIYNSTDIYTNNLYSKKAGPGIGIDIALLRVTKNKFIFGIGTGMELLKHIVPITNSTVGGGTSEAVGKINMHTHFINIKPVAGYRFSLNKKTTLDIAASLDIAIGLASLYEVGSATVIGTGEVLRVENDREEIPTDIRTGAHVKLNVKRYSLLLGYWLGQTNYYKRYIGGSPEAYSKLFRMGLSYRFNKEKEKK